MNLKEILIKFGNYLLDREKAGRKIDDTVSDADLENVAHLFDIDLDSVVRSRVKPYARKGGEDIVTNIPSWMDDLEAAMDEADEADNCCTDLESCGDIMITINL